MNDPVTQMRSNPIWGTPERIVIAPADAHRIGEPIDLFDEMSPWTVRHILRKSLYVPPGVGGRDDVAYVCEPVRWFAQRWLAGDITQDQQGAFDVAVRDEANRHVADLGGPVEMMVSCSSRAVLVTRLSAWLDIGFEDVLRLCKWEGSL